MTTVRVRPAARLRRPGIPPQLLPPPRLTTRRRRRRAAKYELVVSTGATKHKNMWKRYSEFQRLNDALTVTFTADATVQRICAAFPGRTVFRVRLLPPLPAEPVQCGKREQGTKRERREH